MSMKTEASEVALGAAIAAAMVRLSDADIAAIVATALKTRVPEIRHDVLVRAHRLGIAIPDEFLEELAIALRESAAVEAERSSRGEAIRAGHRKSREGKAAAAKIGEPRQVT